MSYFFDKRTSRPLTHAEFVRTYFPSLYKPEHFRAKGDRRVLHDLASYRSDHFSSPFSELYTLVEDVRSKLLYASGLTKRTKEPSYHPAFAKVLSEATFDFEFIMHEPYCNKLLVGALPVRGNMIEILSHDIEEKDREEYDECDELDSEEYDE
jgi:hypothetical protein